MYNIIFSCKIESKNIAKGTGDRMKQKGKTLLFLTALAATTIHIINSIEYSHAAMKNVLPCSENKYYEWRFGKIRYTKKGNGTPILLLHDLTIGSSSYEFHKIVNTLAQKHEVYCMDLLGYGLSDKPDMTFTNYLYVQMVTDFIKNVIRHRTDIIAAGDSFPIAVMTCHNESNLIHTLIGINPQSLYQLNQIPSHQTKILKLLMDTPILGTFIYNIHTSRAAFTKIFQEEYFYNPLRVSEKDIASYVEAAHFSDYHSKHAYASYVGRYTNTNIIHALKEINQSIYLIGGKHKEDINNILENYIYYNSAIEAAYIPKSKQMPHLENSEEVLKYLDIYLN